jgi:ribosomal protein S18 acetylase RimI-like enzyme
MPLEIRPLSSAADAHLCAHLMSTSEPWLTIGRGYDESITLVTDGTRETYVAFDGETFAGFMILNMCGAFIGYIQTIAVAPDARGSGVGTQLVHFAEERISPKRLTSFSASRRSILAPAHCTSASGTRSSASFAITSSPARRRS